MQSSDIEIIRKLPFFFIIGRSRSGTTMLRSMFDAHPNVNIPFESPYIFILRRKYAHIKFWTPEILNDFCNDLFDTNWKFQSWEIDRVKLNKTLLKCVGKNDYQTICKTVHASYVSVFKKEEIKILGDKTPKYAVKLDILLKLFPEAKYIHIIRDYRDQLLSSLNVNFLDSIVPEILYQWKYSAQMIDDLKKKYPDKIFSIRYEDLVNNPANGFADLCTFLNIPFNASSLEYYKKENEIKGQINNELFDRVQKSLFNPIDNSRINNWEGKLNDQILQIADVIAGKTGEKYNYPRSQKRGNFKTWGKIVLRLAVIRLYYLYRFFLHRLPIGMRKKIKSMIPALGIIYYRLFPQDKIEVS